MSQTSQILDFLKDGNTLTPLQALQRFGVLRLGARIWELRERGYRDKIKSTIVVRGDKHFAQYRMVA